MLKLMNHGFMPIFTHFEFDAWNKFLKAGTGDTKKK